VHGVQAGYNDGIGKTAFIAAIDPSNCNYCGECFTACNVRAIGLARSNGKPAGDQRYSTVNRETCLGCGACISACDKAAIALVAREVVTKPAENKRELFKTILREKGKLTPFVISRVKKKLRRLVTSA